MIQLFSRVPKVFLFVMNAALILVGCILSISLALEVVDLFHLMIGLFQGTTRYEELIEGLITFFLYFEFIALIMKYFAHNFHFPLRYFLYIAITAIVRLLIVSHESALNLLLWSIAILILVFSLRLVADHIKDT